VTGDVFENHDGVVDDEARGDRQRHQREDVEAEAEQIHHAEGADDRHGHGDARNDRGAEIREEDGDDGDDEQHRDHQRLFGIEQRGADRDAAVRGEGDVDIRGHGRRELRQRALHAIDGLDDIGAGLAVDDDENRALAVGEPLVADVLDAVDDVADVAEPHGIGVAIGDHQVFVVGGLAGLVVGIDLDMRGVAFDRALGAVGVGRRQRRAHVLEPDAVFEELQRVELDAHGRQRRAADDDLADAVELRQALLQDIARGVVETALAQRVRRQGQDQHRRVGGVQLAIGRVAFQRGRQVGARRVYRGLHVARGAVDVAVEVELERDRGLANGRRRCHLGHVGDLAEPALERARDARRHGLRTCARQCRGDGDGREVDLGQRRDRQPGEGDQPRDGDADRDQRRRDRPQDEEAGNVHSPGSSASLGMGFGLNQSASLSKAR
jgi:hypothetical protein